MKPFVLSRRALLRGGASVALALPLMEAMLDRHGEALADGKPLPNRFGIFFFGNGVRLDRWVPNMTGPMYDLPDELVPLAPHQDYVSVVSGHEALASCCRGHHGGSTAILSGTQLIQLPAGTAPFASKFGAATFDQIAAPLIGSGTTFPTLEIGVSRRVLKDQGPTLMYISHKGPDAPQPPEYDPSALFKRLFGASDPEGNIRVSVLDVVSNDVTRLQQSLGTADRARLDQHLTAIRELEQQIGRAGADKGCSSPGVVTDINDPDDAGNERLEAVSEIMMDLWVTAWACDLNRVTTFLHHGASSQTVFSNLGDVIEEHLLSHDGTQQERVHQTVVYVIQRFARLLQKMKDRSEGMGNLLDHSAIVCTTDTAEGYTHSDMDFPILVAGRANGRLIYPGIHVRKEHANTSEPMLAVLQAVGTGLTSVGTGAGFSDKPTREILT